MPFHNLSINVDELPKAADLELKPVDPRYRYVLLVNRIILWVVVLVALTLWLYFTPGLQQNWITGLAAAAWLVLVIVSWILTVLSFRYKAYAIREHDVVYRTGWFIQSVRVCPFNRIQHCSMDSGLLERRYGLASLSVYTAGGAQADMKLPGLPQETAAALRELLLARVNQDAVV